MALDALMQRDGALREASVAVGGLTGWARALGVVARVACRWDFRPEWLGSPFETPDLTAWFAADGHARLLRWWVGKTEFHTHFNDHEVFELDFMPTGDLGQASEVREMLHALADAFHSPVVVRHEFGDLPDALVHPG